MSLFCDLWNILLSLLQHNDGYPKATYLFSFTGTGASGLIGLLQGGATQPA